MAGFQFGNVQDLNSTITLGSFLAVIAFVVIFDFLIGLMEYFLSGSQLYNRMVQMIYKELMLMGLVSFTIIMVNASQSAAEIETESYKYWIGGVEFSHILLFYLTFFFVTHAFYLMRTSVICSDSYRLMFVEPLSKIVTEVENLTVREKAYFNSQYLPLCSIRNRVEFQLILKLFNETYFLCEGFNFASYLSGCFDRYALKTINRSMFTWFVLMILSILNYTRIKVGFGYHNCVGPYIPHKDGVNDSTALASATIGVAMGAAGSALAVVNAQVVLMNDNLLLLPATIELCRRVRTAILENYFLAISVKVMAIVLAVIGLITFWQAIVIDIGTLLVVLVNGIRFLRYTNLTIAAHNENTSDAVEKSEGIELSKV